MNPTIAHAAPPDAPHASGHERLEVQRFRMTRLTAVLIALGSAIGLALGLSYGWYSGVHLPLIGSLLLAGAAAARMTPDNYARQGRYTIVAMVLTLACVSLAAYSISTLFYFPVVLVLATFGEPDARWRFGFLTVLIVALFVAAAQFYPNVNFGLSHEQLAHVAANDAILAMLFGGVVLRYYVDMLRSSREEIVRIGTAAERDTERSRDMLDLARRTQADLNEFEAQSRSALARTQLRQARLSASQEQQRQFVYAASHDLKEPVRTIRSFLQMVQRRLASGKGGAQGVAAELAEDFAHVERSAASMHQVLESMLEFSRLERAVPRLADVDVRRLWFRTALAEGVPGAADQLTAYAGSPRAQTPTLVRTDAKLLGRLLAELLTNARRFTLVPGAEVDFDVSDEGEAGIVLRVRDRGIGIEPAYHEQVFGLFQRLHGREDYEGSGVGLALVRRIAELLGGSVTLDSALGQGTTVSLRLPSSASIGLAPKPVS